MESKGRLSGHVVHLVVALEDDAIVQQVVVWTVGRRVPQHSPLYFLWNIDVVIKRTQNFTLL